MTTPAPGVPPGAGEPQNRAGQEDAAREQKKKVEAAKELANSTSALTKVVTSLGGWVQKTSKEGLGLIKQEAGKAFTSLKSWVINEVHEFGWIGEKLTQVSGLAFAGMKNLGGAIWTKMREDAKQRKELDVAAKKQALIESGGNKRIYEDRLKKIKEEQQKQIAIEKLEKKMLKDQEKFLKTNNEEKKKALGLEIRKSRKAIDLLNAQEEQQKKAEKTEPVIPKVKPKEEAGEFVGSPRPEDEDTKKAILDISEAVKENSKTLDLSIQTSADRIIAAQKAGFKEADDSADERASWYDKLAAARAILVALPGWLTVMAVGGLMAVAAYLVYTRWEDIVGGFNALKQDILDMRDKIVTAVVDKIEEVVKFGNKLLDWAANLLPSFIEFWKMSVPVWMGGYSDTQKQDITAAREAKAAEEAKTAASEQAAAQKKQLDATQKQTEVVTDTSNTAQQAAKDNTDVKNNNDANARPPAPVSNNSAVVQGGNSTNVHGAPNAGKPSDMDQRPRGK